MILEEWALGSDQSTSKWAADALASATVRLRTASALSSPTVAMWYSVSLTAGEEAWKLYIHDIVLHNSGYIYRAVDGSTST